MENKEIIYSIFLAKFKEAAKKKLKFDKDRGLPKRIAEALETLPGTVRRWFTGSIPEAEWLIKIYKTFGASPNYLLGIEEEEKLKRDRIPTPVLKLAHFVQIKESPPNPEDFVTIPLVSGTIAATIGSGTIVDEHIEDWAIIHEKVVGKRKNLISIRIDKKDGMSMSPILKPGDIIVINRDDKEISPTGIYAVRIGDGCTVKRVQIDEKDRMLLIPENKEPPYRTRIIDIEPGQDTPVIGRVIWCSKAL